MSRPPRRRLRDIQAAIKAIEGHVKHGDISDGLIFDAVRVRLIEVGEAVRDLPPELLDHEPGLPWSDIARMRDHLAHRYFDTTHGLVSGTVENDLPQLSAAVERLLAIADDH